MGSEYENYIKSPEWRAMRERYFASNLPQMCWACDKPRQPGFHIHHRTYKNFGKERLLDLILLCQPCHSEVHKYHKTKGGSKGLWYATRAVVRSSRKARNLTSDVYKSPTYRSTKIKSKKKVLK